MRWACRNGTWSFLIGDVEIGVWGVGMVLGVPNGDVIYTAFRVNG